MWLSGACEINCFLFFLLGTSPNKVDRPWVSDVREVYNKKWRVSELQEE